jgi:acetyltransferase EpsM
VARIVIYGASRQGSVVLETLRAQGGYDVLGFLDDAPAKQGTTWAGLPVLGGMAWLEQAGRPLAAVVAIGGNPARVAVGDRLRAQGIALANAVHPSAIVASDVTMGTGNVVCPGAILVTGTRLEDDVIVNTAASIDHDSLLCTGSQIASGVHTAGCITVGRCAFVGVGAVLGPSVTIGEGAIVGAGAVVLDDLPPRVLAFGTPARVVRELTGPLDWARILGGG